MKKIISIILVIVMATAMSMPIFAANHTFEAEEDGKVSVYEDGVVRPLPGVPITYGVSEKFTIEIPDFINFNDTNLYAYGTIKGTNILLSRNQTLTVTVKSQNSWYMLETNQPTVKLKYDMALNNHSGNGGTLVTNTNNVVFQALPMTEGLTKTEILYCTRAATNQAGEYKDTLTFTCQIVTS